MNSLRSSADIGSAKQLENASESATWNSFLDTPSAEVLLDAIDFLGGTPNPHSLCRHLTLDVAAKTRPIGALITVLETSGALRIAGAFGLDDENLAACAAQTAADASPLAEAIRTGEPIFYASAAAIHEAFPEFAQREHSLTPTAIWPVISQGDRIGAIQLFFGESAGPSPLTADFDAVVSLIALYVRLQLASGITHTRWSTVDRRQARPDVVLPAERRRGSGIYELTERQSVVLDHICAGRTNAQIAHVVGFSESTVRQETMAIYRTLGVEGRGQAAALARAHHAEAAQAAADAMPSI